MNIPYVLQAENIQRSLQLGNESLHILRGISLQVEAGEWIALTGPSGSGKSTLLGILGGIDKPTAGSVRIEDAEISALPEQKLARIRNQKIGIVFQTFNLIPSMTALENVEVPLYIGPARRQARILATEMLEQVGLGDRLRHLPSQLSGGQQQRVAIARALVGRPRLLLADEPTGNLDSVASRQILELIAEMRRRLHLTVIVVTHDPQVAAYADRSLHVVDGRIVAPQTEIARLKVERTLLQ